MDLPMIERALCNEIWGGSCKEVVKYPTFDCPNGHSADGARQSRSPKVVVGWDGESAEVDVEALLRTVLSPFVSESSITKLLEHIEINQDLAHQLALAPNLPMERFADCLRYKKIPVRVLEMMVDQMLQLFDTLPKNSWLTGYSSNEVPEMLWGNVSSIEQEMIVGPVPKTTHDNNLEKLSSLTGDPVFHHSLISEICSRSLPRDVAEKALHQFKTSSDVDVWDIIESVELVNETYGG